MAIAFMADQPLDMAWCVFLETNQKNLDKILGLEISFDYS